MLDLDRLRLTGTEKLYSGTPTDGDIDLTADEQLRKALWRLCDWIRQVGREDGFIMECEDVADWIADLIQEALEQANIEAIDEPTPTH